MITIRILVVALLVGAAPALATEWIGAYYPLNLGAAWLTAAAPCPPAGTWRG